MKRPDDAEDRVRTWLDDEAPGVLPDWVLQQTFERTRQEAQLRGLRGRLAWAIGNNGRRSKGRSNMFSMAPLAAVVAAIALATTAIVSVSVTQDEGIPPGAEAVIISEDVSRLYQGSWRLTGFVDSGETTEEEGGVVLKRLRGQIYEAAIESTDDRITGTVTGTLNQDNHAFPADWIQPAVTQWGTERIENDGGAWECTWSGGEMQLALFQRLQWCVGEGDYDGFALRMLWTRNNDGTVGLVGLAWQGVLPPLQSPTGA